MHKNSNQSQQKAIQHGAGPAMVLAGPGSGKTFVIANRIKHLIESYQIPPEHILVITFTKAASMEMKERFLHFVNEKASLVQFGTFHAVFFHMLQFAYHFDYSNIIIESEKYTYMREILEKCREKRNVETPSVNCENEDDIKHLLCEISKVKNMGISIENYHCTYIDAGLFREIYIAYRKTFQKNRKLDFDDMVLSCYELLKRDYSTRKFWSEKFQYILIDEFQDINYMQYQTIQLLAKPGNNLFVVGDDDQSIYGFRGADPRILQQYRKDFPDAATILLDRNYRCSGRIVEASLQVIQENQFRYNKKIISHREAGEAVILHAFQSEEEQNANIVHLIKEIYNAGCPYEEIALIYRTNARMAVIAEKLVEHKIPFQMKEKVTSIYEHFIAKDLLAYFSFAKEHSRKDFYQIMNKPKRYISRSACAQEKIDLSSLMEYYREKPYILEKIRRLEYDIRQIGGMNPYAAINYIRKGMGYDGYIQLLANEKGIAAADWMKVAEELQHMAATYPTYNHWIRSIHQLKEKLSNTSESKKSRREEKKEGVQILTMHGSKGLEYANVILSELNEGIVPHRKAISKEEIEEERRLLYVAMTRAKERLFLFYISSNAEEKEPSRFLKVLLQR